MPRKIKKNGYKMTVKMKKSASFCTVLLLAAVLTVSGCGARDKTPKPTAEDRAAIAASHSIRAGAEKTGTPLNKYELRATTPRITIGGGMDITGAVDSGVALDIRRDALKDAALSYGARGGLSFRSFEIAEELKGYDASLDQIFNFGQLLIRAPSGLLIEPPIVSAAENALIVEQGGIEAAVADRIYNIQKNAQIVTAPRNWRQYIQPFWTVDIETPPQILWPQSDTEEAEWDEQFEKGWKAGVEQADQIFESNLERLIADFNGMIRYRTLVAQNMISEPYTLHEDRGITGGGNELRIGDRAMRITGQSTFKTGHDEWQPADR
jgi:defect-in-organelle-trafficking protein DotC